MSTINDLIEKAQELLGTADEKLDKTDTAAADGKEYRVIVKPLIDAQAAVRTADAKLEDLLYETAGMVSAHDLDELLEEHEYRTKTLGVESDLAEGLRTLLAAAREA